MSVVMVLFGPKEWNERMLLSVMNDCGGGKSSSLGSGGEKEKEEEKGRREEKVGRWMLGDNFGRDE